jgi:hypothetical protein
MTSHDAAGASRRVANGMRERPRSVPTPVLSMLGTMSLGLGSSRPLNLSPSPPSGKSHVTPLVVDVSKVVAIAGEALRTLDPGQNGNLRSLGKRPHLLEPLPHSKLRTEQWADRPMPGQRANLCPCFLPVNSVDGCERLIRSCRQEIGYFSLHLLRCSSVHLVDRRLQRNKSCGAFRVVSRSPYSGQLLPAWGKSVKSCGFGPGWKGPGLIKSVPGMINDTEAQRSGQMRGSQHGERRRVQALEPMTGPENQEAACARFA